MSARPRLLPDAAVPPLMTACACTGRTFEEVERRMHRERLSAVEAERLTGCGSLCTACLPDLRAYLARISGLEPQTRME
ncbi:MAG TPA: (2Fe-2S)-binding protein [Thermoanaerobaculia bacterium]|nr:(2Fe-2S)-binding protein [Thermoanaerobaculia bacterium]